MSSSDDRRVDCSLVDRVLLFVAERLGPEIDRVEVDRKPQIEVREVIRGCSDDDGASPAVIRAALLEAIEHGWLAQSPGVTPSFDLCESDSSIRLRPAGLVAARSMEAKVGARAEVIRVSLQKPDDACQIAVRFETGNKKTDKSVNRSGVALSAFLLLLGFEPTEDRPLRVGSPLTEYALLNLARRGIFPKRGPGLRMVPSDDELRKALNQWAHLLSSVRKSKDPVDGRAQVWWLSGGFPEVEFEAHPAAFTQEWADYRHAMWSILQRDWNPFVDGDRADPNRTCPEG